MLAYQKHGYHYIFKALTSLSWPIILAFIMQTSYNIVDIFWVGKLGATAIAAVALAGNIFYVVLAVGQILGSGTVALVSHSFGAKLIDQANNIIKQSLLLAVFIALPVTIVGIVYSEKIMSLLGGQGEVLVLSTAYLRIVFIGFFFQLLSFSINYAFRGAGDMKTPMMIMLVATITNIILDPLLILGIGFFPRLEVQGAAIATVIAKFASFLFGFFILINGRSGIILKFFERWKFELTIIKKMLTVGVPVGISYGVMALSNMVIFGIAASFSAHALAALGVGTRIFQFAGLPVVSIGIATTTLVGQSFGSRNIKNAIQTGKVAMLLSVAIMVFFGIIFLTNARILVGIFTENHSVINYGVEFMHIVSLYLLFVGITVSLTGVFRGAGDTLPPMFAGVIKIFLLYTVANLFARQLGMGVTGIWWAMLVSYGAEALIVSICYLNGRWRKRGLELTESLRPMQD